MFHDDRGLKRWWIYEILWPTLCNEIESSCFIRRYLPERKTINFVFHFDHISSDDELTEQSLSSLVEMIARVFLICQKFNYKHHMNDQTTPAWEMKKEILKIEWKRMKIEIEICGWMTLKKRKRSSAVIDDKCEFYFQFWIQ